MRVRVDAFLMQGQWIIAHNWDGRQPERVDVVTFDTAMGLGLIVDGRLVPDGDDSYEYAKKCGGVLVVGRPV